MKGCVFCDIVEKKISAKIVLETEGFIAFKAIKPEAPIHIIVIPKKHVSKRDTMSIKDDRFLNGMFRVVYKVIKKFELDKTGYQLVVNGAGYNHVDHEHIHILGGKGWKPLW